MTTRELYLKHTGTNWPKTRVVSEAVRDAMTVSAAHWSQRFDDAHQAIAEFFGVSQRDRGLTIGCSLSSKLVDREIQSSSFPIGKQYPRIKTGSGNSLWQFGVRTGAKTE